MEEQYDSEYPYTGDTARRSSKGSECFTQAHADAISPQVVSGFDYYPGSPELSDGLGEGGNETKRPPDRWCCWCLLVVLLVAALAAAAAFTTLSVLENREDKTETTMTMQMTFLNAEYDDRLADKSSPAFADNEDKYCSAVKELADSGDKISDFECRVLDFSPGSLRVTFQLTFKKSVSQGYFTQVLRSGIQNNNSILVIDGNNVVISDFTISEISVTSKRPGEGRTNQGPRKQKKEKKFVSVSKSVTVVYEPAKSAATEVSPDALSHVVEFALSLNGVEVVLEENGTERRQDQLVIRLSTRFSSLEESRSCAEMKYLIETGVSQLVPTYLPGVTVNELKLARFLCSETKFTGNVKPPTDHLDDEDNLSICEGRYETERPYFCWKLDYGSENEGPTTTAKPPTILCDEPETWQKSSSKSDCYRPWCNKGGVIVEKFHPSPVCCKTENYQHEGCRCVPNTWVTVDSCTRARCSIDRVVGDSEINPTKECCLTIKNEPDICAKWRQCEPNSWLPRTADDVGSGAGERTKDPCRQNWCNENGQIETDKFRATEDCCTLLKFNETSCHRGFCKGESWVQTKSCEQVWCDSSQRLQFSETQFVPSEPCCKEQSHPECSSSCTPGTWIVPDGKGEYTCELDFCSASGQIEKSVTFPSFYCCYEVRVENPRCEDPLCFPGTNVTETCFVEVCNNKGQYDARVFTSNEECCSSIDFSNPACEQYVTDNKCEPTTWVQQDNCHRSWCNEGGNLEAPQFTASTNCCSTVDGPLMGECLQFVSDECTPNTWINRTVSRPSLTAVAAVSPQSPCYRSWCNPLGRIDKDKFFPSAQCCRLEETTDPRCLIQPLCEPYTWRTHDECFRVFCNSSGLPGQREIIVNRECCERYREDTACTNVTWCDRPKQWVVIDRCFRARCEDNGQVGPVSLVPRAAVSCCQREEARDTPSCRQFTRTDGTEGLAMV